MVAHLFMAPSASLGHATTQPSPVPEHSGTVPELTDPNRASSRAAAECYQLVKAKLRMASAETCLSSHSFQMRSLLHAAMFLALETKQNPSVVKRQTKK